MVARYFPVETPLVKVLGSSPSSVALFFILLLHLFTLIFRSSDADLLLDSVEGHAVGERGNEANQSVLLGT